MRKLNPKNGHKYLPYIILIIDEFAEITKIKKDDFSLIKVYRIKSALPRFKEFVKQKGNMYFCGDWSTEPSIDGAIKSGRLIAENITRE